MSKKLVIFDKKMGFLEQIFVKSGQKSDDINIINFKG